MSLALASPAFRLPRTSVSSPAIELPASSRGGTLISRLNWPSSVAQAGSAIASSTSALRMDGPALVIDQVQLDFQPDLSGVGLEQMLAEHPGEYVQRPPYLVPVFPPVLTADRDQLNVATHLASASQG